MKYFHGLLNSVKICNVGFYIGIDSPLKMHRGKAIQRHFPITAKSCFHTNAASVERLISAAIKNKPVVNATVLCYLFIMIEQ